MQTDSWTTLDVSGLFRISISAHWIWKPDEGPAVWLQGPALHGSGVFVDFRQVEWPSDQIEHNLMESSQAFLNDSIVKVDQRDIKHVNSASWRDATTHHVRTFVTMENDHLWVCQFSHDSNQDSIYIMHWNGPAAELNNIIAILETFRIPWEEDSEADAFPGDGPAA